MDSLTRSRKGQFQCLISPFDRWAAKVQRLDSGCWLWTAYRDKDGYGLFTIRHGHHVPAHRFAFEQFRFPIPAGHEPDHLCRNPWCVNPFHLEAVPQFVNNLRSNSPSAINAKKTHCVHGHEFTPANTHHGPDGRVCRQCKRNHVRINAGWNIDLSFTDPL